MTDHTNAITYILYKLTNYHSTSVIQMSPAEAQQALYESVTERLVEKLALLPDYEYMTKYQKGEYYALKDVLENLAELFGITKEGDTE